MKTIGSFDDLRPFGIIPLTAEADATGTRLLCDLTRPGVIVFATAFGLNIPEPGSEAECLAAPWNNQTDGIAHVASVLIPCFEPGTLRHLAIFALGLASAEEIWVTERGGVIGLFADDRDRPEREYFKTYQRLYQITRRIKGWISVNSPRQHGDRNVHQMSGRAH